MHRFDPERPSACMDWRSARLIAEMREPLSLWREKTACEDRGKATGNGKRQNNWNGASQGEGGLRCGLNPDAHTMGPLTAVNKTPMGRSPAPALRNGKRPRVRRPIALTLKEFSVRLQIYLELKNRDAEQFVRLFPCVHHCRMAGNRT